GPVYSEFESPRALPAHRLIDVTASALSRLAQGRAAGTHYSSGGGYPFVVGVDGVGRVGDGRRVYFFGAPAPFGAMAERTIVPDAHCVPLPDELDDVTAAAIAIPGMSSWAALTERTRLAAGETVLVNGATGTSGRLAVRIAKHLGAAKVTPEGRRLRFVQIGSIGGADVLLPGAVLRATAIELMGSGLGSVPLPRLLAAIRGVFGAVAPAGLAIETRAVPLSAVGEHWG
ncbi:zinc-binding alcohol dehydrogenase family protein, partial [Burkholderia anthina]|uniref:zinc-binding alcohol dehydrogenase family protein n=1 Tax=Burkholderia anthina TaxID=179879 RepID=UPI00158F150A